MNLHRQRPAKGKPDTVVPGITGGLPSVLNVAFPEAKCIILNQISEAGAER